MGISEEPEKILAAPPDHYFIVIWCSDCFYKWFSNRAFHLHPFLRKEWQTQYWDYPHTTTTVQLR